MTNYKEVFDGPNTTFYEDNHTYLKDPITSDIEYSEPINEYINIKKLKRATNNLYWRPYIKSFLVTRNNKIIWEKYLNSSNRNHCNNVHSVSKSILSTLVGIAIDRKLLDINDKVSDILSIDLKEEITIKHLLTMTAGFKWYEDYTEYSIENKDNWVEAILNRRIISKPGEVYNYNTGLSHVLSAIIQKATGSSTCKFAHETLFDEMDMNIAQWSWDPNGIFCGGFNVYISPIDLIKFSLLYLNKGVYLGKRIVSQEWIEESTAKIIEVEGIHYGYYWWVDNIGGHKVYYAWGHGGQFVYIIPELKMTIVITCDTQHYSRQYDARSLIRRYIISSVL